MEQKYKEITAPQLGVNDESAILVEWLHNDKEKVSKEDAVCILESTKATFEVNAPDSGYLAIIINEEETVEVHQVIGIIIFDEKIVDDVIANYREEQGNEKTKISITKKAEEYYLVSENTPPSVAAGSIYLVSMTFNLKLSKKDISKQCKISEVTICKCYKKRGKNTGIICNIWRNREWI